MEAKFWRKKKDWTFAKGVLLSSFIASADKSLIAVIRWPNGQTESLPMSELEPWGES